MPERHQVWAAPLTFGPWAVIANYLNSVTYKVEVTPIGDIPTLVLGELRYWNEDNEQVVLSFKDSETITTGNSMGNLEIRLQGTPTGTSCYVETT